MESQQQSSVGGNSQLLDIVRQQEENLQRQRELINQLERRLEIESRQKDWYVNRIKTEVERNGELEKEAEKAYVDPLTGLLNRAGMCRYVKKVYDKDKNKIISIVSYDLDDFKGINDNLGHLVGDKVLIATAKTLKANLREGTAIVRTGGEEISIFLENASLEDAYQTAERLRKAIENEIQERMIRYDEESYKDYNEKDNSERKVMDMDYYKNKIKNKRLFEKIDPPRVTASAGITSFILNYEFLNKKSFDIEKALEAPLNAADQKLYEAKNSGKNITCGRVELIDDLRDYITRSANDNSIGPEQPPQSQTYARTEVLPGIRAEERSNVRQLYCASPGNLTA